MSCIRSGAILFLLLMAVVASAQKNSTIWPYDGEPDERGPEEWVITFDTTADFFFTTFDSTADFTKAIFERYVNFYRATFKSTAYFDRATFKSTADFSEATFDSTAGFRGATFDSTADFWGATFDSTAYFGGAIFDSTADFREAKTKGYLDFEDTEIHRLLILGSSAPFKIDLTFAAFSDEAKVELVDEVDLKMPVYKLDKLVLRKTLTYTQKNNIIDFLKKKSFSDRNNPDDMTARLELDYLFERSTMYQVGTDSYEKAPWYHVWHWPQWLFNTLYYWTMGFGYRPFRLIWWAFALAVIGTIFFFKKMGKRVNAYVAMNFDKSAERNGEKELSLSNFETLLNCAYFSVMLLFTFRMKGNLLTFFNASEKKIITVQWALGLAMYFAFLLHTSSVLQNLKSLFAG